MNIRFGLIVSFVFVIIYAIALYGTVYTASTGSWSTMVWNPNGTPGPSDDIIIPDAAIVTIDANFTINNLTVGGGTTGTLQFSQTVSTSIMINGDILINHGGVFTTQSNTTGGTGLLHTLELKGNLTHNGSNLAFRHGTAGSTLSVCNLTLSGTTNSVLTVNQTPTAANGAFNSVTINKIGGAKVILGNNLFMSVGSATGSAILNSTLTFINGIIETGPYIWICLTTSANQVTGYSSASYINGAMGRGMSNVAGSSKDFPVGDSNGYRIFNLRSTTAGMASGHYAIVRCIPGDANNGSSVFTNGIDKVSKVRYFQVSFDEILLLPTLSMNFDKFSPSYGSDDGVEVGNTNLRVAYSTDNKVTWNGLNQSAPHITTLTSPPTRITPDSLASPINLNAGVGSIYVSLASVAGTSDNTLPSELSSFVSNIKGCNIVLNWETKTEKNSDKFIVERKTSSSIWKTIGSVKAAVLSNSPKQYSFTDKNLQSGKYQYRLNMIDNDGTFKYSKVIETEVAIPKNFELSQNFPNPFNPSTNINYTLPVDSRITIEIYNINGERIDQLVNEEQSAGYYTIYFNSSTINGSISSGVYFYRMTAVDKASRNNFVSIKKMMLLK